MTPFTVYVCDGCREELAITRAIPLPKLPGALPQAIPPRQCASCGEETSDKRLSKVWVAQHSTNADAMAALRVFKRAAAAELPAPAPVRGFRCGAPIGLGRCCTREKNHLGDCGFVAADWTAPTSTERGEVMPRYKFQCRGCDQSFDGPEEPERAYGANFCSYSCIRKWEGRCAFEEQQHREAIEAPTSTERGE